MGSCLGAHLALLQSNLVVSAASTVLSSISQWHKAIAMHNIISAHVWAVTPAACLLQICPPGLARVRLRWLVLEDIVQFFALRLCWEVGQQLVLLFLFANILPLPHLTFSKQSILILADGIDLQLDFAIRALHAPPTAHMSKQAMHAE